MNTRTLWVVVGVAAVGALAGCDDGGPSEACPEGSWAPGGDAGSVCAEWTPCPAGQYELGPGTATSDRVCVPCSSGSTDRACVPDRDCVPGEYINTASTGTGGAACTSCPSGTFSVRTNARSCMDWSTCSPGQYVLANGAPGGDRICGACPSGRFSTVSNAASCTPWSTCEAGERELSPGSDVNDRTCLACPPGTYTSGPNQTMCVSAGDCLPGMVQTVAGTPTSPAVCTACTAGQHCAGAASPAVACGVENWDHDADPATACVRTAHQLRRRDVRLERRRRHSRPRCAPPCATGLYSGTPNAVACTPWSVCSPGTFVSSDGDATHNRTCSSCMTGSFSTSTNAAECTEWVPVRQRHVHVRQRNSDRRPYVPRLPAGKLQRHRHERLHVHALAGVRHRLRRGVARDIVARSHLYAYGLERAVRNGRRRRGADRQCQRFIHFRRRGAWTGCCPSRRTPAVGTPSFSCTSATERCSGRSSSGPSLTTASWV
jgi:hypothetical protein